MTFDYKKEYKEFYLPPRTPGIVTQGILPAAQDAGHRHGTRYELPGGTGPG